MGQEELIGTGVLRVAGKDLDIVCSLLREELPRIVLSCSQDVPLGTLTKGARAALIERRHGQTIARSGHVVEHKDGIVALEIEPGQALGAARSHRMTECQLPAMLRTRSASGQFGGWRGAVITKHGPTSLHVQVEEGRVVPREAELLFNPIGSEGAGHTRGAGDEAGMMSASDVRSRRIRVKATTSDVLPGEPGMVTLVLDVSRTLYRSA